MFVHTKLPQGLMLSSPNTCRCLACEVASKFHQALCQGFSPLGVSMQLSVICLLAGRLLWSGSTYLSVVGQWRGSWMNSFCYIHRSASRLCGECCTRPHMAPGEHHFLRSCNTLLQTCIVLRLLFLAGRSE